MSRRVVITGMGVVTPLGDNLDIFWENIIKGKNSSAPIRTFDTSEFPHHNACEVNHFDFDSFLTKSELRFFSKASQFSIVAVKKALKAANLNNTENFLDRIGVIFGTTFGEAQIIESATKCYVKNERIPSAHRLTQYNPNMLSVNLAKKFKIYGPNFVVPAACAAGNYAIYYGYSLIKSNKVDGMIVGGADPLSHVSFSGFSRLGVMSESLCQPFDKNRKGMLVGEGAGALVLEEYNQAKNRGAHIYAEVLGCGISCDAKHMTIPNIEGVATAMRNVIEEAGISYRDIDYICAHGTGTIMNDKTESTAITELFYKNHNSVPVSSIKSMIGHTMGAASAIEAIACVLAIKNQIMPPTINFQTKDPDCNIDCIPNTARQKKLSFVINNAFAFGGNNSALLLGRV